MTGSGRVLIVHDAAVLRGGANSRRVGTPQPAPTPQRVTTSAGSSGAAGGSGSGAGDGADGGGSAPSGPAEPPPPQCVPVAPQAPEPAWPPSLPDDGAVGMNPDPVGLTGLESRFWWTGTSEYSWTLDTGVPGVAADCSIIPPPTLQLYAFIATWEWQLGDDRIRNPNTQQLSPDLRPVVFTADDPGDEQDWAVGYTYEVKSPDRVVTVNATWVASDLSLPPLVVPAGSRAHPVQEMRAVLLE